MHIVVTNLAESRDDFMQEKSPCGHIRPPSKDAPSSCQLVTMGYACLVNLASILKVAEHQVDIVSCFLIRAHHQADQYRSVKEAGASQLQNLAR